MGCNGEILDMLEHIKAMYGVRDVIWSEIVQVIGRKEVVAAVAPPIRK
jgi:hypothetical protein